MSNNVIQETHTAVLHNPFKPAAWLNKIDFINHLVLLNNVLITVLSDEGGGKTTFSKLLQEALQNSVKTYSVNVEKLFEREYFLSQVYDSFLLRKEQALSLADIAGQINERKAHVLIIIDNAHQLPQDFIREILLEIRAQENHGYLHWCLLANFNLLSILNAAKTGYENLIHTIELGGLSENETRTYLLKNLANLKRIDITMSDKRLEQFYQLTGGSISRINLLMNDFFNPNPVQFAKKKSGKSTLTLLASFLIVFGGVGYLMYQRQVDQSPFPQAGSGELAVAASPIRPIEIILPKKEVYKPSIVAKNQAEQNIKEKKDNKPIKEWPLLASYIPAWTMAATHQALVPPPLKKAIEVNFDEEDELGDLVVSDKVLAIPKTVVKSQGLTQESSMSATQVSTQEMPASRVVALPTLAPAHKDVNAQVIEEKAFTIQLLSSPNLPDIKRYIAKHTEAANTKIYKTMRQNKEWYVLTMGVFNERQSAQKAIKQLPAELARQKPWVRPLSSLVALG